MKFKLVILILFAMVLFGTRLLAQQGDMDSVEKGLATLFRTSISEIQRRPELIEYALYFKQRYTDLTAAAPAPAVHWGKLQYETVEFSFPSLIQRANHHPSNLVYGYLYVPRLLSENPDNYTKAPATIILHHISDDISIEKKVAHFAASMELGVVMMIYLPHYGPRRSAEASFITNNQKDFELNILQTLVDIHQAQVVLRQLKFVDENKIQLFGVSLGALIALVDMGFDTGFESYGSLVGGGDLAQIMTYKKEQDPGSDTSKALKDINWTENNARFFLSRLDAITWAPSVHGKKIFMWNADQDELVDKMTCVIPLANELRAYGNDVHLAFFPGRHHVDIRKLGIITFFKDLFFPILRFFKDNTDIRR